VREKGNDFIDRHYLMALDIFCIHFINRFLLYYIYAKMDGEVMSLIRNFVRLFRRHIRLPLIY
jgi:predicted PolB exonuclease-like 3'-5' exonuclease